MAVTASNPPSFFKVLLNNFKEKLLLPRKFIKHYHGNVPKKIILRSPTGVSWMVSVRKVEYGFFLCKEWREFVKDHALEAGQFLVFHGNSVSDFSVQIFGRNGCGKEVLVATTTENKGIQVKEKVCVATTNESKGTEGNGVTRHEAATIRGLPSFTITYCRSRLYKLILPRPFVKVYMPVAPEEVILRVSDGRVWNARCSIGIHYALVGGWKSFVKDNNLKDGDICNFELVKRNPMELHVSIYPLMMP